MHQPLRIIACTLILSPLLFSAATQAQSVQVVRATNAPVWGTELRVVEELRIGALEGAEHLTFGDIEGVAVGRNGDIYVADDQVPAIRMFDARGRYVRTIGRRGEGPGEYRAIGGLRALHDGRLALWDNRNMRIVVYSPEGEYVASHRVASGLFAADIFEVAVDGHFYVRTVLRTGGQISEPWRFGWIRVAPDGAVRDTIPIPHDEDKPDSFVLSTASGYDRPFTTELVTALSPLGYLITGRSDRYAFDLHRPGAPVLRIERPFTPVRLHRDERAEWEAWARFFERRAANPPAAPPNVRAPAARRVDYDIPEAKPAYSELRTDASGRIWVRRYVAAQRRPPTATQANRQTPSRAWREPPTFDVFEPTGVFLGTVTLPWNSYFWNAADRHVYVTVRGELDEEYVVRLRIDSAAP